jgi:hypothetical protein
MAVVPIKSDRQLYPDIGFSQGQIVGKVDRNLHDLRYFLISTVDRSYL